MAQRWRSAPAAQLNAWTVGQHGVLPSLILIRHAEAFWSPDEMRPLSAAGRAAAEKLAEPLAALELGAIYSSPYRRAIETVEPLAKHLGLPIREVGDLRERALGSISGIPFEDAIADTFSDFDLTFPGGESSRSAQRRAVRTIDRLVETHRAGRIAISTHGNLLSLLFNAFAPDIGFQFWRCLARPDVFRLRVSSSDDAYFERLAVCAAQRGS